MIHVGINWFLKPGLAEWLFFLALLSTSISFPLKGEEPSLRVDSGVAQALGTGQVPPGLLGSWIWDAKTFDGQTCRFWCSFDIPPNSKVVGARLLMTADNEFSLYLDGREVDHGAEWRDLFDYNLVNLLGPGRHVLAIEARNSSKLAGMLLGMQIDLEDGQSIQIKSDTAWRIVPEQSKRWKEMVRPVDNWPAATVVGTVGMLPRWPVPDQINPMLTPLPVQIRFWQTLWFQIASLTLGGLLILVIFLLYAQLAIHRKERWLLQRERARIAMDVHDDIGSRMTHLVLNGEVSQDEMPVGSKARAQLAEICEDARGVLASIDEILWALNPRQDNLQDFAHYVCDYTQRFLAPSAIECVFEMDSRNLTAAADLPLRRSLLMGIKEALNNTVKYSEATELHLKIGHHRNHLVVIIEDNGKGFDMASVKTGRHGLANMSKRMSELGGTCSVTSQAGKGCRVKFRIPLRQQARFSLPWKRYRN